MKSFSYKAVVARQVVDDIVLRVEAESEQTAAAVAHRVLTVFPEPHDERGVPVCYIKTRATENLEVLSLVHEDISGG